MVEIKPEPPIGVDVRPEERRQTGSVGIVEKDDGIAFDKHAFEEQGVDVHEGGLQQVQGQHLISWLSRSAPVSSLPLP